MRINGLDSEGKTAEAPMSVSMFLTFLNQRGALVSREWFYRKLKANELPHLRLGKKILVMPSQVLAAMGRGAHGPQIF